MAKSTGLIILPKDAELQLKIKLAREPANKPQSTCQFYILSYFSSLSSQALIYLKQHLDDIVVPD